VEVEARSLYEAVGFALARFKAYSGIEHAFTDRVELTVEARLPAVSQTVTVEKFRQWLKGEGGKPFEVSARYNVREALKMPHP
jgi:hypothetical protein